MNTTHRIILIRLLTGYVLLFLLLRLIQYATPSGYMAPPLFSVQLDITYWIFRLLHFPEWIGMNQIGALFFDSLLFLTGILTCIFPLRRVFLIPFSVLLFLYSLSFNFFGMHQTHSVAGLMVVFLPFWFSGNARTYLLWQGIRYYTCFVYTMSFVWKTLIRDVAFFPMQGVGSFRMNFAEYLFHNPDTWLSGFYRFFLRNEWMLNTGNVLIVLLEGIMVIGFFTKKYDRILFWVPVTIHLITYLFSDVWFFELLVLDFSLLGLRQLERLGWLAGHKVR